MLIEMLQSKIHMATVTGSDLYYEGSIAIDRKLCKLAGFRAYQKVDIYNCATGARFSTYVILGKPGDILLNGAAARLVQKGDKVIIVAYGHYDISEIKKHKPTVILVDDKNRPKIKKRARSRR